MGQHSWIALASLLAVSGCRTQGEGSRNPAEIQALEKAPWGNPGHVIAEVNGRPITRGDFYARVLRRFGTAKLLSGVIKEEIFFQEAERRKIEVQPEEIDAHVQQLLGEMAEEAGGEQALIEAYRREGIDVTELRRDFEREVYPQIVIGKVTKALRKVDEAALRQYYQETYKHTRYVTRHIAYGFLPEPGQPEGEVNRLKLEAFNKAARAADRARKGGDFAAIARAESEDSVTAPRGGELGPIHEDSPMEPGLKKAIFALRAGDVSDPVENPNGGYHIFQVTEVLPGESFVDVREKMRTELLEREPTLEEIEVALRTLREEADVKILGSAIIEGGDAPSTRDPAARAPGSSGSRGVGEGGAAGPRPATSKEGSERGGREP